MRKKKTKEPILPALVEEGNHHNRLREGDEVYCYDGKSNREKVTVIEVDKKAKVVKLSNRVVCSRYPDSMGLYHKQGMDYEKYVIKKWDKETELLVNGNRSRQRLMVMTNTITNKLINLNAPIECVSEDTLNLIINIDNRLTKILKEYGL